MLQPRFALPAFEFALVGALSVGAWSVGALAVGLLSVGAIAQAPSTGTPQAEAEAVDPVPGPAPLPADRRTGAETVTESMLREWLGTLASPEFGGRGTGQAGFELAANYVRAHFKALGLEPGGPKGSYFQEVPWLRTGVVQERSALTVERGGETRYRALAGAALHGRASVDSDATGDLAVVITATADGSDLAGLDLEGKAVLALVRAGDEAVDQARTDPRRQMRAMRAAFSIRNQISQAGGSLLAVVDDDIHRLLGPFTPSYGPDSSPGDRASSRRGRMPTMVALRQADLDELLAALDAKLDLATAVAPAVMPIDGASARLAIDVEAEKAPAYNVLAILRGADPDLRDEFVGVGCHLDHLGRSGDTIHPGADDDGSGSTGLMAIAQAFAKNPERPARSLIFMAFCGEENGLKGSAFFAANPTVPLEQMIAELQLDMIGRNEESDTEKAADNTNSLHLVGSQKLSSELHEVCVRLNEERAGFDLEWDEEGVFYRSDHWNFAREGVPIAFLFTGFHADYHRPSDTPDKIDFAKLHRVWRYAYDLAYELADGAQRPRIDADRWEALERKSRAVPAAPLREVEGAERR